MSASKKAVKKSAAKPAASKAKPAAAAKKATPASAARKPVAKGQKVNTTDKKPAVTPKTQPAKKVAPAKTKAVVNKAQTVKKPAPKKAVETTKSKSSAPKGKAVTKQTVAAKSPAAKSAPKGKTVQKGKPAPVAKSTKSAPPSANPISKQQAKPATAESGTKSAASPARTAGQKSETAAKPAPKKAKYIFVKQSSSSKQDNSTPELDAKTKELVLNARKRTANGNSPKGRPGKGSVTAFTMDDVVQVLAKKQSESQSSQVTEKAPVAKVVKKQEIELDVPQEKRVHSAVSLSDILGFNPAQKKDVSATSKGREVPRKWSRYHKLLVDLREQMSNVLEQHTAETLKRSNRDDSGDLSGYGQHMADAGTDTFDRDFALSMVSSEQEALFEINEAIERIYNGSYGVCEITGETISAERLEAVPFTRYSLEGQKELEKTKRQKIQRGGVFTDNEDNISFDEDEN